MDTAVKEASTYPEERQGVYAYTSDMRSSLSTPALALILLALPVLYDGCAEADSSLPSSQTTVTGVSRLTRLYGNPLAAPGWEVLASLKGASSKPLEFYTELFRTDVVWSGCCGDTYNERPGYLSMMDVLSRKQPCDAPLHPAWVQGVLLLWKNPHEDRDPGPTSQEIIQHDFRVACQSGQSVFDLEATLARLQETGEPHFRGFLGWSNFHPDGPCRVGCQRDSVSCKSLTELGKFRAKTYINGLGLAAMKRGCPDALAVAEVDLRNSGGFARKTAYIDALLDLDPDLSSAPGVVLAMVEGCEPAYYVKERARFLDTVVRYASPQVKAAVDECIQVAEEHLRSEAAWLPVERQGNSDKAMYLRDFLHPLRQRLATREMEGRRPQGWLRPK